MARDDPDVSGFGPATDELQLECNRLRDLVEFYKRENDDLRQELVEARLPKGESGRELVLYFLAPIFLSGLAFAGSQKGTAWWIVAGVAGVFSSLGLWRLGYRTKDRGINVGPYDWLALCCAFVALSFMGGAAIGGALGGPGF